jgi:hypothetical protein
MAETLDLTLPGRLVEQTLTEVKALRREVADVRSLAVQGIEFSRRLERRLTEQGDDLQLVVKSEIMARLGHFETAIEGRLGQFEATVEGKLDVMASRIADIERGR